MDRTKPGYGSVQPSPPGTFELNTIKKQDESSGTPKAARLAPSAKGVEQAKKRLRAFSIQKKAPLTPAALPKPAGTGNATVLIGKLSNVKAVPKPDETEVKKPPKPPKPGASRRSFQDSYTDLQKRTLSEIEDMKRKMELVELGIPLGLICPSSTSEKAMPTKAMPPIKSFLDPAKVDELIREAKKAKVEGKEFKFDYQKLLPDYDNPFQRKREETVVVPEKEKFTERRRTDSEKERDKERRRSDKYESRRHSDHKKDDKYKDRDKDRSRDKHKDKKRDDSKDKPDKSSERETDVNLSDYLVCDSWSLDNEEKTNSSSPKTEEKLQPPTAPVSEVSVKNIKDPKEQLKENIWKKQETISAVLNSPVKKPKIEKLKPVMDSFKFEIDPNDDEIVDIFDEDSSLDKYNKVTSKKYSMYGSPIGSAEFDPDTSKDVEEGVNDDTFLESVINEIKQEDISDASQDKALVEYDMSPIKEEESPNRSRVSITPELDDRMRDIHSRRSDYSDGYRSSESYKTNDTSESGYKSVDSFRMSTEKELDEALEAKMSKSTIDSLETWSFVLKICQPLLFRHDKNKCYRETRTVPKLWYTENPKLCKCVKDRSVVYDELEMCKMNLVDRVYGCDQIPDAPFAKTRNWYPRSSLCFAEVSAVQMSSEWEADDSQGGRPARDHRRRSTTPQRSEEVMLDREYQRFMEAVWPEVSDAKADTSRSTTPVRQESKKKKKEEDKHTEEKQIEEKKSKKPKLSSEGWSQESDIEEEEKSKKVKLEKSRKRKRSSSTLSSVSESDDEKKNRKALKRKATKKAKSKSAKRRRMGKKILKKLKEEKQKRKKKYPKENSESEDEEEKKNERKKLKRKKPQKTKKKTIKRKKKSDTSSSSDTSSTSSSSSSSSESESDRKSKKIKKRSDLKKKRKEKKKRKKSTSESAQSEELFDVNILNNIKTERLTDDEKIMEFSPRRQNKLLEIINVKELQNDFVGSNIMIKQEVVEEEKVEENKVEQEKVEQKVEDPQKVEEVVEASYETVAEVPEPVREEEKEEEKVAVELKEDKVAVEIPLPVAAPEESNLSQCSSQESVCSIKETKAVYPAPYEKDESHLRPSSQNSNYSFNDVIASSYKSVELDDKYEYEAGNYEMYEQLAMAYQSDVASQVLGSQDAGAGAGADAGGEAGAWRAIETVVRSRGEIKCDWRAGHSPAACPRPAPALRPTRWGLKPGDVNIVLTGGECMETDQPQPIQSHISQPPLVQSHCQPVQPSPVYRIQSLAKPQEQINIGYDEAYMDMYGASDRLQYGDCFGDTAPEQVAEPEPPAQPDLKTERSSLDARIDQALRDTVLGEVAKDVDNTEPEKELPEKGILITGISSEGRAGKRVSFADGYKPGQDSDVEEPPVKKRKRRRYGCAWPCPATHPDHVPLWDALPPPPPPASPPPPARPAPPTPTARRLPPALPDLLPPALRAHKADPNISLAGFMPEPPPGFINFKAM